MKVIRIRDGVAINLTEKEIEDAKKKRPESYWIMIKNEEDSFVIDEDKNKVRPFIRDYIARMPGSIEMKYLMFIAFVCGSIFLISGLSWWTNDSEKKIETLSKNMEDSMKKIEEMNMYKKPASSIPQIIQTGSTQKSQPFYNPLSNATTGNGK